MSWDYDVIIYLKVTQLSKSAGLELERLLLAEFVTLTPLDQSSLRFYSAADALRVITRVVTIFVCISFLLQLPYDRLLRIFGKFTSCTSNSAMVLPLTKC